MTTERMPDRCRPNVFEIDLDAIASNVAEIRRFVGPDVRIFAAMKANGYGFGVAEVAPVLEEAGVDTLCVVDLSDAVRLRERGIALPILLYGGNLVSHPFLASVEAHDLWVTITDIDAARRYSRLATTTVTAFVKVDVGLERLGVPVEEARNVVCDLADLPRLRLEGIYTHVHVPPGEGAGDYVAWQLGRFDTLLGELRDLGIRPPVAMAASSPIVPVAGAGGLNGIDVGRLIYGSMRSGCDPVGPMRIRNAFLSLSSRLIQVKTLWRADYASLAPFEIRPGMRMGIAPFGYADGLDSLNAGCALVHGQRVPLLAGPSLEHTRLDLTTVPDARVGDEVVFVGQQGDAEITPDEVLEHLGFEQPARMAVAVRHSVRRVYRRTRSCR